MGDYLALDATAVAAQIDRMLIVFPELADDEALRADMLEGSTDLHSLVSRALDHRQEAEEVIAGIKSREAHLSERRARYERRSEAMKALIKSLMQSAQLDKITLPEATVSITKARESVSILDIDELPQGMFSITRTADKKAILAAIKGGEDVPGAGLVTGETGLMVRTK